MAPGDDHGARPPGAPLSFRLWALAGLGALAGFFLFRVWAPPSGRQNAVCLLRLLTGIPCPGCGMTRAFAHLAKGEWAAAARSHLLAFPLAAELAGAWLVWGIALARRPAPGPPLMPRLYERWLFGHMAVLVAFWLGRAATGTLPW